MDEIPESALWWQWGHAGVHHGVGTVDCPRTIHHHHDEHCKPPPIARLFAWLAQKEIYAP